MLITGHPRLDELHDFLDGAPVASSRKRTRLAAHLERCARCQASLRDVRAIRAATAALSAIEPPPELRSRVLAARDERARVILPVTPERSSPMWRRGAGVAAVAAAVLVVAAALLVRTPGVEAGASTGVLRLTPASPRAGQPITVTYEPPASLQRRSWLALRARLRSPNGKSYNDGVPITTIARLRPASTGASTFTGTITLPDSVVFAALAVEDSAGTVVDDDAGRAWEVLLAGADGKPLYAALNQRTHDLMGRNWEEGLATVQRMISLYPNQLDAWNWLLSYQSWLGRAGDDSVLAIHRAKLAEFDARFSRTGEEAGLMAWYARSVDSATYTRWRKRLMQESPRDGFAIQWRLYGQLDSLRLTKDTARAISVVEALWSDAEMERRRQVAAVGYNLAAARGNADAMRLWADRIISSERDQGSAALYLATRLASRPVTREEGMRRLRATLADLDVLRPESRRLDETVDEQRRRQEGEKRKALASLGRALVAAGQHRAGLDTLALASSGGWDLDVFRAVRTASIAAGDQDRALTMLARLAVDPRTDSVFADSAAQIGARALGSAGWASRVDTASRTFAERMLEHASTRSLPASIELRDIDGATHELRDLANGHVTVVAFWSRFCGPAVEDLPRMNAVAERLTRKGARIVSIVEEARTSPELAAFLRDKKVTMPTYFDTRHEASRAFNQWGTPYYYVLDADGRVRFDVATTSDEVLARAEVLLLKQARRTASR